MQFLLEDLPEILEYLFLIFIAQPAIGIATLIIVAIFLGPLYIGYKGGKKIADKREEEREIRRLQLERLRREERRERDGDLGL